MIFLGKLNIMTPRYDLEITMNPPPTKFSAPPNSLHKPLYAPQHVDPSCSSFFWCRTSDTNPGPSSPERRPDFFRMSHDEFLSSNHKPPLALRKGTQLRAFLFFFWHTPVIFHPECVFLLCFLSPLLTCSLETAPCSQTPLPPPF